MPSYEDFDRDYHADDREDVLARMRQEQQQPQAPQAPTAPAPVGTAPPKDAANQPPPQIKAWGSTGAPVSQPAAQQPSAAPAAGATGAFDRTSFREQWMAMPEDRATQDAFLRQHNLTPDGAGRVTLPTGEIMDLRFGARAGGLRPTWTGAGGTQNGVPVTSDGGGSGGSGGGLAGAGGSGAAGGATGAGGSQSEMFDLLMRRATQGTNISRNDPSIRGQADAYSANATRESRNYLSDLAERSGPNANLRGEQRLSAERLGQNTGAFESELMGRELTARRAEIQHALDSARGMLSQDQMVALQRELAQMDNAIRQQQIGVSHRGLDLQGRGMDMQNDISLRGLGLSEWDRGNYWDSVRSGLIS